MWISTRSSFTFASSASSCSYDSTRAFGFACLARGAIRTHSSSRGERPPPRGLLLLLDRQAGLLLLEPRGVVALERDAVAAVELEDPAGDVVEEVAVVGHGEDGAGVFVQEPLEPRDRLGVEVVGRLVEQQQVGRRQQDAAQCDPAALAAGEGRHVGVARRQRSASIAMSSVRSRFQASVRSIRSCTSPCSSRSVVISSSDIGSANRAEISSKRWSRARFSATPSSTFPRTSLAGSSSGSCGRKPTVAPGASRASPKTARRARP